MLENLLSYVKKENVSYTINKLGGLNIIREGSRVWYTVVQGIEEITIYRNSSPNEAPTCLYARTIEDTPKITKDNIQSVINGIISSGVPSVETRPNFN